MVNIGGGTTYFSSDDSYGGGIEGWGGGSGGTTPLANPSGYNWDLQLGSSLTSVSDIYTIQIRTVSGATTGDAVGALTFWDLTG